jgi:hypothetical protein
MKINRQRLKEIIKSVMSEEKSYEEFFRGELEKAGFSSPAEMSDVEKREFFSKIDSEWNAKNEELTGNQHKLDIDGDGEIEASDLSALRAGKKPVKEQESFDFGNDEVNGIFAKFKKLNPKKTQRKEGIAYSYNYGTGGITFIVKDNNVKFAMFQDDRVHDFLVHMQSLGFGSDLFARLTKLARKKELKGYTTVLHFGQPKNEGNAFGAAVTKAKKEGDKEFKVGGKVYPVKEAELPKAQIPSSIKAKLDHAIDKIQNSKLTYNQKLQVVGKVVDSLGIDKAELSKMSSKLKTTLESVNEQKSKYYVEIDSPREVDSNRVKGEIKSLMRRGAKSVDIGLRMNFLTTNPKDMMNKFQKVKNHVYFANDPMRFESVNEGVMKPGKKIKLITGWAGQNQPTKNDKYVVYQLVNNRHFSMRGLRGGMTYLWKAIESTDPHIKVGSTEEIHPKALKQGIKHGFYVMESVVNEGRHDKDLDKVEAAVKNASSFMGVGAELKKAGIKYDFSTSMMPMYRIEVAGNTIAIVNKRYASGAEREVGDIAIGLLEGKIGRSLKVENLSPDVAKHMIGIYKGFILVNGDGTMTYDTPANAKKAAQYLNKNKIAASSDGKYLYIESKTRR